MYGTVETDEERLEHLLRLRDLQDETGGFTAFITWSYQPEHTELGGTEATGVDYLRTLALARIVLDNFDNLQASWVTQGGKVGQLSLALRRQRHGQRDDRGERRPRRRRQLLHGRSRDRPQHRGRRLRRRSAATCTTTSSAIRSSASATCRACSSWRPRAPTATPACPTSCANYPARSRAGKADCAHRFRSRSILRSCDLPAAFDVATTPLDRADRRAADSRRLGRRRSRPHRRASRAAAPLDDGATVDLGEVARACRAWSTPTRTSSCRTCATRCRRPRSSSTWIRGVMAARRRRPDRSRRRSSTRSTARIAEARARAAPPSSATSATRW